MVAEDVHQLDDRALMKALRALGDPTRFRMVQEVADAGELCCGELAGRFEVTQPTISHHLKVLLLARVLSVRNQGKHRYISVNEPTLWSLANLLPVRLMPPQRSRAARPTHGPRLARPQDDAV